MNRFGRSVCASLLLLSPTLASAQTTQLWKEVLPARATALNLTPAGTVLVQLKNELFAIQPDTGERRWSRNDVTGYMLIGGTPFVMLTTATGQSIADIETGRDRWTLKDLGFTLVKGQVHLPAMGLMLVYGEAPQGAHTLVATQYETGRIVWKQASLFSDPAVAKKASKIRYRDYLVDSDHSVVIDPSAGGLVRLDLQTGEVYWRLPEAGLPSGGKAVALHAAGDQILVEHGTKVFAVGRTSGQVVWSRTQKFPSSIVQVAATAAGLLVRGSHTLDSKGRTSWKPYLTLIDPRSGATMWTNEKTKFEGRSAFLLEGDKLTVALKDRIASYDLASGRELATFAMAEFSGGESACCLERTADGGLRVWSSQNLRLFDASGAPVYSTYLKAPGLSFATKFAMVAVAAAMTYGSMSAAAPGGYYSVYSPGPALLAKFKATTDADHYAYVFTEEDGNHPDRFALVRIDKATGKDTGRLNFTSRVPSFQVDPMSGIVVHVDKDVLSAMRFAPASPLPSVR